MKIKNWADEFVVLSILAALTLICLTGSKLPKPSHPIDRIQADYSQNLVNFEQQCRSFEASIQDFNTKKIALNQLKKQYLNLRKSYKKIEYILEYQDKELVWQKLNGAPFDKIEPHAPSMVILKPCGLQVIDQVLYENQTPDIAELRDLAKKLSNDAWQTVVLYRYNSLSDRIWFEAARQNIVRQTSLAASGFDVPASMLAVSDLQTAIYTIKKSFQYYSPALLKPKLASQLSKKLDGALIFLSKTNGFEQLDQLVFTRKYLNPIYGLLLDAQQALNIEDWYQSQNAALEPRLNPLGKQIFSSNFLNSNAYIRYPRAQDTKELRNLGQMLFFDPVLSQNNERSCASCHKPDKGFADGNAKSIAYKMEGTVNRNSPGLVNAVFAGRYFWDLRAEKLEDQVEHVLVSEQEFHTDFMELIEKISKSKEYVSLFKQSFAGQSVSKYTISTALAAYVKSLVSLDSDFDRYMRLETQTLPAPVLRGYNLFMGKGACGTCHFAPLFSGLVPPAFTESESEVLGTPSNTDTENPVLDPDRGRYLGRMKERADIYLHAFRTPTVRNSSLTAPYMHNGVYKTLEQVMDFYNRGGGQGLGLDVPNQTLSGKPLDLSRKETRDIIAFMESLNAVPAGATAPKRLPFFDDPALQKRVIGGLY